MVIVSTAMHMALTVTRAPISLCKTTSRETTCTHAPGPAAAGLLVAAGLAAAGTASAASAADMSAADTVRQLTDEGYSVQINGTAEVPLSECRTTGVHGIPDGAGGGMARCGPPPSTSTFPARRTTEPAARGSATDTAIGRQHGRRLNAAPFNRRLLRVVDDNRYADWEAVYRDNVTWVYRTIFARVGTASDAEDLTAEVFLAALRPLRLTATKPEIRAYLRATARTVLAAHWRETLGHEVTCIEDLDGPAPDERRGRQYRAATCVGSCWTGLPDHYRTDP